MRSQTGVEASSRRTGEDDLVPLRGGGTLRDEVGSRESPRVEASRVALPSETAIGSAAKVRIDLPGRPRKFRSDERFLSMGGTLDAVHDPVNP
jgi:hypothetical protein